MGSTTAAATSGTTDTLGGPNAVEVTGKVMVVAIIFLFMVVVFVLMLHLYAKWFWWSFEERTPPQPRNRRRSRLRRRFVFAPGQDPAIYGTNQIGLDVSILKSLPVLVFNHDDFKDGLECAVCLCDIVEGEKTRLLPKCNHGFHLDCIDMWFQSHSTCPLCRNLVSIESSKPNSISNDEERENLSHLNGLESSNFPTNVLVWGNYQTQVSTSLDVSLEEANSHSHQQQPCSTSSTCSTSSSNLGSDDVDDSRSNGNGMLVIDIPIPSEFSSESLSSSSRCVEDEMKSPMSSRLRSFKRLLSRDKKLSPCSPSSMDVEQGQTQ